MLQCILPMQYTVYWNLQGTLHLYCFNLVILHFNIVAVYLQCILQTSWSVHSVYTAFILPYTVSLLQFGLGKHMYYQEQSNFVSDIISQTTIHVWSNNAQNNAKIFLPGAWALRVFLLTVAFRCLAFPCFPEFRVHEWNRLTIMIFGVVDIICNMHLL